jgi:hypothetical protein
MCRAYASPRTSMLELALVKQGLRRGRAMLQGGEVHPSHRPACRHSRDHAVARFRRSAAAAALFIGRSNFIIKH